MHVFRWQIQQPNHNAAPELGVKLGLIINDMHKALGEVKLHVEVRKVCRNAASQALQAQRCHFTHFDTLCGICSSNTVISLTGS